MSTKSLLLSVLGTAIIVGAGYMVVRPEASVAKLTNSQAVKASDVNAYGFRVGMPKEEFLAAIAKQKADPNNFFVKWMTILSEDEKTVVAFGAVFPSDKFMEVAKEVARKNGGSLNCEKSEDGNIACDLTDANGNTISLVGRLFVDSKGHTYGGIALADKNHSDPKHPTTPPENEKHESGSLNMNDPTCAKGSYALEGKCVSDL